MLTKEEKESAGIFGGSKKIVVDRCRNCLFKKDGATHGFERDVSRCTHPITEGRGLDHLDLIPLWCPLEDN